MRFRKLRIAWSVVCGIACVLMIVLWVRSYWYHDGICYWHGYNRGGVESIRGNLLPFFMHDGDHYSRNWHVFSVSDMGPDPWHLNVTEYPTGFSLPVQSFTWYESPYYFSAAIPHWFGAFLIAALGSIVWLRWRFSLRTLLIATTLVAVVVAYAVYAARN